MTVDSQEVQWIVHYAPRNQRVVEKRSVLRRVFLIQIINALGNSFVFHNDHDSGHFMSETILSSKDFRKHVVIMSRTCSIINNLHFLLIYAHL